MADLEDRIDQLESRIEEQQSTIERYRRYLDAGKWVSLAVLVAVALAVTGVSTTADPQGMIGTSDDPLVALFTEEINGGVTGERAVSNLTGPGITIDNGSLSAASAGLTVSDGTTSVGNVSNITYGTELSVTDDGGGTVTVDAAEGGASDTDGSLLAVDLTRPFGDAERIAVRSSDNENTVRGTLVQTRATVGSEPVVGLGTEYGFNDTEVMVDASTGTTNDSGYDDAIADWPGDGRTLVYASAGDGANATTVTHDRLVSERFEDDAATLRSNGWQYNDSANAGDAGIKDIGSDADSGTKVAYINGDGGAPAGDRAIELNYTVDTTPYDTLVITYVAREPDIASPPDTPDSGGNWVPGENLRLQYNAGDDGWITVDNVSSRADGSEPEYYYRTVEIAGVENVSHDDLELRFRQGETTTTDEWQIDSVFVDGLTRDPVSDLNQEPQANFRYSPNESITTSDTVTFDATRSDDPDGNSSSYDWDWDDDGTYEGSGEETTHTFASNGTYPVTLAVTDEDGKTRTTTRNVTVT